jgi:uncharacterized protein YgbK (DUF1537 family)
MTPAVLFAAVADDDTGASDLAGMLADRGVRAMLVLDPGFLTETNSARAQAEAVVLATASLALPPRAAYPVTAEAVRLARSLCPCSIQIKLQHVRLHWGGQHWALTGYGHGCRR